MYFYALIDSVILLLLLLLFALFALHCYSAIRLSS